VPLIESMRAYGREWLCAGVDEDELLAPAREPAIAAV
jgi:hypothetical protein